MANKLRRIIEKHTLYPLYAPFIGPKRAAEIVQTMLGNSGIGLHTQIGMVASKVQPPRYLRYCPVCHDLMLVEYGELYWRRTFQVTGIELCPDHKCELLSSHVPFRPSARHEYLACAPANCMLMQSNNVYDDKLLLLGKNNQALFSLSALTTPTCWQWSHFYHQLAQSKAITVGQKVLP